MKYLLIILALLCAVPAHGQDKDTPPLITGASVVGGTCAGGQFVTAISASGGVPTCTNVTYGNLTPAPTASGQMMGANGTAPEWETLSNDCTLSRTGANAYSVTCTKTNGVAFTGLATAAIPLTIPNGGTGWAGAPTAAQMLIAQNTSTYTPRSISGDATITLAGVLTVTKINGITPGGTCGAGTWVSSDSSSAVPTCTNPWASPTLSGTITFPDSSTYTSAGHNNMAALGVGTAAGAAGTIKLTGTFTAADTGTWSSTGINVPKIVNTNQFTAPDSSIWTSTLLQIGTGSGIQGPSSNGAWDSSGFHNINHVSVMSGAAGTNAIDVKGATTAAATIAIDISTASATGQSGLYVNNDNGSLYTSLQTFNSGYTPGSWDDFANSTRLLTNMTNGLQLNSTAYPIRFSADSNRILFSMHGNLHTNSLTAGLTVPGGTYDGSHIPDISTCHEEFGVAASGTQYILSTGAGEWNTTSSGLLTIEAWDNTDANAYAKQVCTYVVDFDAGGNEWVGGTTISQLHCGHFNPSAPFTVTVDGDSGSPQLGIKVTNTATYHENFYIDYLQIHGAFGVCTVPTA